MLWQTVPGFGHGESSYNLMSLKLVVKVEYHANENLLKNSQK